MVHIDVLDLALCSLEMKLLAVGHSNDHNTGLNLAKKASSSRSKADTESSYSAVDTLENWVLGVRR